MVVPAMMMTLAPGSSDFHGQVLPVAIKKRKPCCLSRHMSRGFTLLELLVVVVTIAVVAAMVAPGMINQDSRRVHGEAERMAMLLNLARQEALLSASIWRLHLDPETSSYQFLRRSGNEFTAIDEAPFRGAYSMNGIHWLELQVNAAEVEDATDVYLFPSGEQHPFQLTLSGSSSRSIVRLDAIGAARVLQDEDDANG